jgi:hypothetical protein
MMYRFYIVQENAVGWVGLDRFGSVRFSAKTEEELKTKIDQFWDRQSLWHAYLSTGEFDGETHDLFGMPLDHGGATEVLRTDPPHPACLHLAEHFIADTPIGTDDRLAELAHLLETTIRDWIVAKEQELDQ